MMKLLKVFFMKKNCNYQKNTSGEYVIEIILRIKGNQIYVKLRGYGSSFNSWIDKNTVTEHL